ncbi:hypothetical protein [Bacillus toyonensis]|uniref:hypothetical protein n=1 Tax=Bacillus toyonensis TaxID=155322 RepID=UPI000BFB6DD8|nr:hypothetical protein [Bacillus toyonensis]PHG57790.1 hypothetical protein COI59_29040 [Bacillus toyonensis]
MHENQQVALEKIQQKIKSCIKEANHELDQNTLDISYKKLYEKFKEIEIFICLLALYLNMDPDSVKDSLKNENRIESVEPIK